MSDLCLFMVEAILRSWSSSPRSISFGSVYVFFCSVANVSAKISKSSSVRASMTTLGYLIVSHLKNAGTPISYVKLKLN